MQSESEKKWRIQCVPFELGRFENRQSLPATWRGLRDEQLDKEVGIEGCVFVHQAGFTGGHKTFEGVLQMARKALVPVDAAA